MDDTRDEGMTVTFREGNPGGKRIVTLEVFHESLSDGMAPVAMIYLWAPENSRPVRIDTTVQGLGQLSPELLALLVYRVLDLVAASVASIQDAITTHGFDATIAAMRGLFDSSAFRPSMLMSINLLLNAMDAAAPTGK